MDLRVTSTGRVFYQIESGVAALLCEMFPAAIERVAEGTIPQGQRNLPSATGPCHTPRPAAPKQTQYCVATKDTMIPGGSVFCIKITKPTSEEMFFDGEPERAPQEIPAAVIEEYKLVRGRGVRSEYDAEREYQKRMQLEAAMSKNNAMGIRPTGMNAGPVEQ